MRITQDYLQDINNALLELLDTIPCKNATWSVRDTTDNFGCQIVEVALIYASEFKHDHFQEGTHDHRTVLDVIAEWTTYIDEAKNATPTAYTGDAQLVNDAMDDIICYLDDKRDIDTYLITHLIGLRDKLHTGRDSHV